MPAAKTTKATKTTKTKSRLTSRSRYAMPGKLLRWRLRPRRIIGHQLREGVVEEVVLDC